MRRFNSILFVFLIIIAISVLTAWSFQSAELRGTVSASQAAESVKSGSASAASVTNVSLLANADADKTVQVGVRVQLDGSHSTDVDGAALTFNWSLVSAPAGSTAALTNPAAVAPTFLADRAGNYVVQLIV